MNSALSRRWATLIPWASLLPSVAALLFALACASALALCYGQAPLHVYRLLLDGTWGNPYGVGQVLFKSTPLILTGLAVSLPFQAGLFNVGAEGQVCLGAFAAGILGASLPPTTAWYLALPLCLFAAAVAGGLAGALPGVLKAYRGAHEVIVTIMLNFVIVAALSDVGKRYYLRETVHTAPVIAGAVLPRVGDYFPSLAGSAASAALPLAILAAVAVGAFLRRTIAGFRLRAVGLGPDAAASSGISVARQTVLALFLGGALAGLSGGTTVLGYKRYYEEGFSGGVGFMGIAVALLGRNHPAGIVAAALLFGTLAQGGLAINAVVPKELVDVLQAVIILAVAAAAAVPSSTRIAPTDVEPNAPPPGSVDRAGAPPTSASPSASSAATENG